MHIAFRLILTLLAVVATIWATPALAAGEGSISGQVVNETPGGSAIGLLDVTLITYSNGKQADGEQKTTVDSAGRFEFKGLSTETGTTYRVGTTFQDADYISPEITLTAESLAQSVELSVYDATTSDANIYVSNGHIIAFTNQGGLDLTEVWRFSNVASRTFTGTKGKTGRSTLQFTLPDGAVLFSPGEGFTYENTDTGVVFTRAVPPGVTDISFTYVIPYQGSNITISRKADYPIADFRFLVEDTGVKVTSAALTAGGVKTINGTNYQDFFAGNLAKGATLDASFSGIVKPNAASSEPFSPLPWLLGGIVVLGLVFAFAYTRLKKKQMFAGSPASLVAAQQAEQSSGEEDALLQEMARLDDDHGAGMLEEAEYRARRSRAKGRLAEIFASSRLREREPDDRS